MRKVNRPTIITKHLQEHSSIYIFHIVLLLMGIIFGAIIVNSLSLTQKEDLFYFINEFFIQLNNGEMISAKEVFHHTLAYNSKFIGIIWILGISMIGLPLIFVMVFLKGMLIGFTVGFLVQQMGWYGFLLSFASVLPQNLIALPVYIVIAVLAFSFSLKMIKKLFVKSFYQPFAPMLVRYCIAFGIAILFLSLAAFVEGYITPYLMKGILNIAY